MKDEEAVARIVEDFETAGLDGRRLAMLRYARKLTLSPSKMERTDVQALRDAGFKDEEVLGMAEVVAYYAYANRIVDGLGVDLEE
ncbi:MAG: peroxidase [Planctomycetes bacterium]|jgi:uncharacterized peroxidase-related enzyme|nr:peroxidase [Planctomycetota bacterium]